MEWIHSSCEQTNEYPDALVFSCFSILHELGHWEYFIKQNVSIDDYIHQDRVYRESNKELIAKPKEKFLDYRKIPSEKAADQFALGILIELMDELLKAEG